MIHSLKVHFANGPRAFSCCFWILEMKDWCDKWATGSQNAIQRRSHTDFRFWMETPSSLSFCREGIEAQESLKWCIRPPVLQAEFSCTLNSNAKTELVTLGHIVLLPVSRSFAHQGHHWGWQPHRRGALGECAPGQGSDERKPVAGQRKGFSCWVLKWPHHPVDTLTHHQWHKDSNQNHIIPSLKWKSTRIPKGSASWIY